MHSTIANPDPIVSLSLNPAIDLTYQVSDLRHEQKSRASVCHFDPGGTGINVGRALQKLNNHSHTCYFSAGTMGQFLDSMLKQQLDNTFSIRVKGETRINTTILQDSPKAQYEINATGPKIQPDQLKQLLVHFFKLCKQGIAILTGSLPPGLPPNTYQKINTQLQQQGARCIIDAPVTNLRHVLSDNPFIIKPNLHELESLCGKTLSSHKEIATEAKLLTRQGIHYVCVSLAEQGAILTSDEHSYYCSSPNITPHSTVGAGDSLVAGLAHAFSNNLTEQEAIRIAVACGAGTAIKPGTQLFDIDQIKHLYRQTNISKLAV